MTARARFRETDLTRAIKEPRRFNAILERAPTVPVLALEGKVEHDGD